MTGSLSGASEWREYVVDDTAGERLDAYLAARLDISRTRAARMIEGGRVLLNGAPPRKRDVPRTGDRLSVLSTPPEPADVLPEALPLHILFEDEDLLVLDKPPGMVVHPAAGHRAGTLVNALLHAVRDLSGIGGVARPGIIHRLDKDTSGLMIVAKNDFAHTRLSEALRRREVRRRYLVAAWGHVAGERLSVDAPIARHRTDRKRMAVVEGGRRAITHFRTRERWVAADLLEAQLETGRTHQIRVHLLHVGHPVVGDETYGAGRERGFSGAARQWALELARRTPRQFLHAWDLRFTHPRTAQEMRFRADLPEDLRGVAEWARATVA